MSLQKTITKEKLIDKSKTEFLRAGYSLWSENIRSNAFDFIAKQNLLPNSQRIIIKVLVDLDLFKKQTSVDLQLISKLISGFPLIVAHSAAGKNIKGATLYRRHDVSAISIKTLKMFLQYEQGLASSRISKFSHRGGVFVNLSKEKFKERRKQLQLEMTILSKKVGISRHSLYKYERGESFPKIKNFELISEILGENLDLPIDILETQFKDISQHTLKDYQQPRSNLQKEITNYLEDKEFKVLWFRSEPFDGLSEPKKDKSPSGKREGVTYPLITGVSSSNEESDSNRISLIDSLSTFLKKKAIWFVEDEDNIEKLNPTNESSPVTIIKISDLEGMALVDFKNILKKKKSEDSLKSQRRD